MINKTRMIPKIYKKTLLNGHFGGDHVITIASDDGSIVAEKRALSFQIAFGFGVEVFYTRCVYL